MTVQRIHVVGGPGSGKTTLALQLGERLGLPVHHLDDLHRAGGGNGPRRPAHERDRLVERIAQGPVWVTEGVHLGWTDPFIEGADLVVWLDTVSWGSATRRVLRRFVRGGREGLCTQPAPRDGVPPRRRPVRYARHLRALGGAVRENRLYYRALEGTEELPETRAATGERLSRRAGPVAHCRTEADVAGFLASLW